ncbi:MAG: DUF6249 domain-containing protein [bacterium]|nr:hypothetical protein [Gammaproteobacteria bacterium]HIL99167.1 hypothetical protein [Pseudomonadales bacterium]
MENLNLGIGAGLAALAFWGFVGIAVIAGVWDNIRKREAQHETIRRLIESGQPLDHELMAKLSLVANGSETRQDQALQITGLWLLPVSVGLGVFGVILGSYQPEAFGPLLGVSALTACMAIGFLISAKVAGRWYPAEDDSAN